MCYLCNKEIDQRVVSEEGSHACGMFISIGLLPLPLEKMSADTHNMMMRVFMRCMTPGVSLTSGRRYRLANQRWSRGRAHLRIHTCRCESCLRKYYTSIVVRDWKPRVDENRDRSQEHGLHLHGGHFLSILRNTQAVCQIIFQPR